MKIAILFFTIFVLSLEIIPIQLYAEENKCPENYLLKPDPFYYKNPREIWEHSHDNYAIGCWKIFADKQDLCLYNNPDSTSKCVYKANFLEDFFVDKREGKFLHLKGANKEGWGNIQEFILLNQAVRTEFSVTHKGLPVNNIDNSATIAQDKFEGSKQISNNEIRFLDRPPIKINEKYVYNKNVMKIMKFAYIYNYYPSEEKPEYVLLGKKNRFFPGEKKEHQDSINSVILGWVKFDRIMRWNTREALQPDPNREYPIYFFKSKDYLESYYSNNKDLCKPPACSNIPKCNSEKKHEIYEIMPETCKNLEESKNEEFPNEKFRYAILKANNDPKVQPFYVGIPTITSKKVKIGQFISERSMKSDYLDIVFLFDATTSMSQFIPLLSKIVKKMVNTYKKKLRVANNTDAHLRFGVALYRDYYDKLCINNSDKECKEICNQMLNNNNVIEKVNELIDQNRIADFTFQKLCHLTEKISLLEEKINHVDPINQEYPPKNPPVDPAYFPEAVYQGIMNCISQMKWRDFAGKMIIHIGDAGNHSRGFDNITPEKIAELLVKKDISYIPIQLLKKPSADEPDYVKESYISSQRLFSEQCRRVLYFAAQKEKELINDFYKYGGVTFYEPLELTVLNSILDKENEDISCHSASIDPDKICNECGKDRWTFSCISFSLDKDNKIINPLRKSAVKQISNLCKDVESSRHILEIIDGGILPSAGNIYSPHLIPREIKKIINDIGMYMYQQKDKNSKIHKNIIEIIGNDLLAKSQDKNTRFRKIKEFVINTIGKKEFESTMVNKTFEKEIIHKVGEQYLNNLKTIDEKLNVIAILGANEFNNFLKAEAQFYTTAYIKQYVNEKKNIQLYKTIFLSRDNVLLLIDALKNWSNAGEVVTNDQFREFWEIMLKVITFSRDEIRDKSISFTEAYQKQFGISLRSEHPILSYSYSQIKGKGNLARIMTQKDIDNLIQSFKHTYSILNDDIESNNKYFYYHGYKYTWVPASDLL